MDEHEVEDRINDLEMTVEALRSEVRNLSIFSGVLLGRLAAQIGTTPDLRLPLAAPFTDLHDTQLKMILAYNDACEGRS